MCTSVCARSTTPPPCRRHPPPPASQPATSRVCKKVYYNSKYMYVFCNIVRVHESRMFVPILVLLYTRISTYTQFTVITLCLPCNTHSAESRVTYSAAHAVPSVVGWLFLVRAHEVRTFPVRVIGARLCGNIVHTHTWCNGHNHLIWSVFGYAIIKLWQMKCGWRVLTCALHLRECGEGICCSKRAHVIENEIIAKFSRVRFLALCKRRHKEAHIHLHKFINT